MNEIEDLFKLLRKKENTFLKEGSIVLELDEQELIVNTVNAMIERKYNQGFIDCVKKYQEIYPSPLPNT